MQTGRQQLTSAGVIKMFRINWSPTGSNRRRAEEEVILNFTYYLSELEGMWFGFYSEHSECDDWSSEVDFANYATV